MQHAIGVDLGGTKTAAGVVSASGEVLFSETIATLNRDGGEAILDATAALVSGLVARAPAHRISKCPASASVRPGSSMPAAEPWFRRPTRSWAGPGLN